MKCSKLLLPLTIAGLSLSAGVTHASERLNFRPGEDLNNNCGGRRVRSAKTTMCDCADQNNMSKSQVIGSYLIEQCKEALAGQTPTITNCHTLTASAGDSVVCRCTDHNNYDKGQVIAGFEDANILLGQCKDLAGSYGKLSECRAQ